MKGPSQPPDIIQQITRQREALAKVQVGQVYDWRHSIVLRRIAWSIDMLNSLLIEAERGL